MKPGSRVLLVILPGLAAAVAAISVMTLNKSNIAAASFPPNSKPPGHTLQTNFAPISQACPPGDQIVAAGIVEPPGGVISIGSPVGGIVARVLVRPGMTVRKGDPLFELDRRAAQATLAVRRSELLIAQAQLLSRISEAREAEADVTNAEASLDEWRAALADAFQLSRMAQHLESSSHISKRETLRRHYLVKQMQAKVRQAKAVLEKSRNKLQAYSSTKNGRLIGTEKANIKKAVAEVEVAKFAVEQLTVAAPQDGTIYQVNVRPGERAAVDSTALIRLGRVSELNVKVDLYEGDLSRFDNKMSAAASRRLVGAAQHNLTFVRIQPIVVPKTTLSGRRDEKQDTRVLQVIYRLQSSKLYPGEVVDVVIRPTCDRRPSTSVDISLNRRG